QSRLLTDLSQQSIDLLAEPGLLLYFPPRNGSSGKRWSWVPAEIPLLPLLVASSNPASWATRASGKTPAADHKFSPSSAPAASRSKNPPWAKARAGSARLRLRGTGRRRG